MATAARSSGDGAGLIILGLVVVGGVIAYKRVVKPGILEPLKVKQVTSQLKVYITHVNISKGAVTFSVRIENPNSAPITVKALVGDTSVIMNGGQEIKLGNVSKYGNIVIQPTAQTDVNFSVKIDPINFVAYTTLILSGKVTSQSLQFNGTINIDGRTYPVKELFRIS